MAGFKLDANGDIEVDNSGKMLLLATKQELVKQRLQIKLKTFKGEWWLDTTYGIPYRDTGDGKAIIGKGFTKKDIDALYIAAINEDVDVNSIEYFRSEYDSIQRMYNLSFEVRTSDELLMSAGANIKPWEEETYQFNSTILSSSCNVNFNDWATTLHPIVHTYLPYGSTFGWLGALDIGLNTSYTDSIYMVSGYIEDGYFN